MKTSLGLLAAAVVLAAMVLVTWSCGDEETVTITPVTHDNLVQACIVSSACKVKTFPRVSNCVDAYYNLDVKFGKARIYDKIYQCVVDAEGDCDEVYQCYGTDRYAGGCDTTYRAYCDGDTAYNCDTLANRVFAFECKLAGLTCSTRDPATFEADCTTGTCSGASRTCEGDVLVSCKTDGNLETFDCSKDGRRCAKSPLTKQLECTGNQKTTCDIQAPYKAKCLGTTAVYCVNNHVHRWDCSKNPWKKACKDGACVFAGKECTDSDFNRCKGSNLQYCDEGKWVTFDCAKAGLGPCKTLTNGADCS